MFKGITSLAVAATLLIAPQAASALKFTDAAGSPITDSGNPISMSAAADFNDDGRDDIAFGGSSPGFKVMLSQADGTFAAASGSPFGAESSLVDGASSLLAEDVNGDGDEDVLIGFGTRWEVYFGNGDGTFPASPDSSFQNPWAMPNFRGVSFKYSSTLGDVDDDGDPDLVVGMYEAAFDVVLNDGNGVFTPQDLTYVLPEGSRATNGFDGIDSVAIGDWDGNGDVDLALAMSNEIGDGTVDQGIYVADGHGDGTFTPDGEAPLLHRDDRPSDLSTLRLNADSYDDLFVTFNNNYNDVPDAFTLIGGASGLGPNPAPDSSLDGGYFLYQQTLADLDGDGWEDVVVGVRGDYQLVALKNHGDGGITPFPDSPFDLDPVDGNNFLSNFIFSGDFDGDGYPDLAADSSHSGDPDQARGIRALINRPSALASPASAYFGTVLPGHSSSPSSFTVANTGGPPAQPTQAPSITGEDADDFVLGDATCGGGPLDADASCTLEVTFAPDAIGQKSASLVYPMSNQDDLVMPLSGSAGEPAISVTPASQDFGEFDLVISDPVGKTFVITNPGTGDLATDSITISGDNADDFELGSPPACDLIEPGDDCPVQVWFRPQGWETGARTANLVIENSTVDHDPVTVPLTATATLANVSVSPDPLDFGETALDGTDAISKTLTLTSDGTASLLAFVGFAGEGYDLLPESGPFTVDDDQCLPDEDGMIGPIPPGEDCPLTITFDPTSLAEGEYTADLRLDTSGNSLDVQLSAKVVRWEGSIVDVANLGSATVGETNEEALELRSTGSGSLRLAGASIEGADASSFEVDDDGCAAPVPPESSCAITVRFTPASEGGKSATLEVSGNFGTEEVALTGTGLKADDPDDPDDPDNPTKPKARLKMRVTTPRAVKPGRVFKVKVKVRNTGDAAARRVKLKAKVPARLARKPKALKIKRIAPGKTVTRTIRIKVKRTAKKGRKLKVKVIASGAGIKKVAKKKSVRIRRR